MTCLYLVCGQGAGEKSAQPSDWHTPSGAAAGTALRVVGGGSVVTTTGSTTVRP